MPTAAPLLFASWAQQSQAPSASVWQRLSPDVRHRPATQACRRRTLPGGRRAPDRSRRRGRARQLRNVHSAALQQRVNQSQLSFVPIGRLGQRSSLLRDAHPAMVSADGRRRTCSRLQALFSPPPFPTVPLKDAPRNREPFAFSATVLLAGRRIANAQAKRQGR